MLLERYWTERVGEETPMRPAYCMLTTIVSLLLIGLLAVLLLSVSRVSTANEPSPDCLAIDDHIATDWSRWGGLPVVGYPITTLREEIDSATGQRHTVQWFERMRLEVQPANDGTYQVLPARLGVERLHQLSIDWTTLPREAGPQPGCLWFEETGHNVCDQLPGQEGFRSYWQAHGVRDPQIGNAYAQSMALFGLPISSAEMYFNETYNTFYIVQWFERARFEWHQDQPEHARVLLGLLGRELLADGGDAEYAAAAQVSPCPIDSTLLQTVPSTAPLRDMLPLEVELQSLVTSWSGEHAVSVTDLQTGQTVSVNGNRRQLAACTIKIPLMIAIAQDIEAGHYTADDVDALVRSAMGPSNTAPARDLIGLVGNGDITTGIHRINQIMWDMGAANSLMTHPPGYYWMELGYAQSHGTANNVLTTNDLNLVLGKLYHGKLLSPELTEYVLWSMTIAPDWMNQSLGAPLPAGVSFYHKVGQIYEPSNTWNDAGVVVFERDGQPYAYAISYLGSYGASWNEAYTHAIQVSEVTWHFFNSQ